LVDCVITTTSGWIGRDGSPLLLGVANAHIGHTNWPPMIVWPPPQIIADVHQRWCWDFNFVAVGPNGIARADEHSPRPSGLSCRHNVQTTNYTPAMEVPVVAP